jgi:hypothetical protein
VIRGLGVLAVVLGVALPGAACASQGGSGSKQAPQFHLRLFASGLDNPVYAGAPRSERGRLYVVEKPGVIRVFVDGRLRDEPFLDIRRLVGSNGSE